MLNLLFVFANGLFLNYAICLGNAVITNVSVYACNQDLGFFFISTAKRAANSGFFSHFLGISNIRKICFLAGGAARLKNHIKPSSSCATSLIMSFSQGGSKVSFSSADLIPGTNL